LTKYNDLLVESLRFFRRLYLFEALASGFPSNLGYFGIEKLLEFIGYPTVKTVRSYGH